MTVPRDRPGLIDLDAVLERTALSRLRGPLARILEGPLGIKGVNAIHAGAQARYEAAGGEADFFLKTLEEMGVNFSIAAEDYRRIPLSGPLLVVANHPFGGVDGVVLGAVLRGVRADAKLLGNYLLSRIEGLRESIIEVDPFDRTEARRANLKGMRESVRTLAAGGCLGVFPAGEVSSLRLRSLRVTDRPWTAHVVNLARRTGAKVLPVFIEGRNSSFFQVAGLLHPRIRTLLLAREFARMRGAKLEIRIGEPVPPERLERFDSPAAAAEYLRLQTYALREDAREAGARCRTLSFPFGRIHPGKRIEPLAPPVSRQALRKEVEKLSPDTLLVEHNNFRVFIARAAEIPDLLLEIGRLREETFRSVGEGTGSSRDLDAFDPHYRHLFMWDQDSGEVVGAYRIGLTDEILRRSGRKGLYTTTLFRFKPEFLQRLGPAMELGRSFVALKYQKKHASLALIWRGIGEFVVRNPRYRTLFGPVSITDEYNSISKNLMVHFLREHNLDPEMSRFVRAKNPPHAKRSFAGVSLESLSSSMGSIDVVSAVVSGFEKDKKGIPILLRHYLKLNGTLLSFNVDPDFSDVIDGLILVDLLKTEPKLLHRYMGPEGAGKFLSYNGEAAVV